mmetsp:Transcript_69754/g.123462  ORF Transcript_69754/g.123462 Transcript_69754/m.123462 type:complete len:88 (-) Transcript_69754:106-369(-)
MGLPLLSCLAARSPSTSELGQLVELGVSENGLAPLGALLDALPSRGWQTLGFKAALRDAQAAANDGPGQCPASGKMVDSAPHTSSDA